MHTLSHTHLAAYVSGVIAGAAALALITAPHLHLQMPDMATAAPACAGRVSPAQAEALRAEVVNAERARLVILRGGSLYAAAKVGPIPGADLRSADAALSSAVSHYAAVCTVRG